MTLTEQFAPLVRLATLRNPLGTRPWFLTAAVAAAFALAIGGCVVVGEGASVGNILVTAGLTITVFAPAHGRAWRLAYAVAAALLLGFVAARAPAIGPAVVLGAVFVAIAIGITRGPIQAAATGTLGSVALVIHGPSSIFDGPSWESIIRPDHLKGCL